MLLSPSGILYIVTDFTFFLFTTKLSLTVMLVFLVGLLGFSTKFQYLTNPFDILGLNSLSKMLIAIVLLQINRIGS